MKKKYLRIGTGVLVAAIGAGALFMFAGCTSNHPEIRITYEFQGETYDVDYTLSRVDAPKTVQHFIELADAHFYDGLAIHDYKSNALFSGGYEFDKDGVLQEVNYLERVRALEEDRGKPFTQTVWEDSARQIPLYTVKGEFKNNGIETQYAREYKHTTGALVMYYTEKGTRAPMVTVQRAKKDEDGNLYETKQYTHNSATSLFYTWLSGSTSDANYNGNKYCVFGMAKDYNGQLRDGLLAAINEYIGDLAEGFEFTKTQETVQLNQYDHFRDIRAGDVTADFETPVDAPIIIKTVKVTKY